MFDGEKPFLTNLNAHIDERGSMSVMYEGLTFPTKIIKMTTGKYGVLRGFHYQNWPLLQNKLIVLVEGIIQDVCLEMNNGIPTGKIEDNIIDSRSNNPVLFIPKNWAHAYLTLSESSKVLYLCDQDYGNEISFNPLSNYRNWKIPNDSMIISQKDLQNVKLSACF